MECVNGRTEHAIWYPWHWNQERGRWERECAIMCCRAWQYTASVHTEDPLVVRKAGQQDHGHAWSPWYTIDEDSVPDNLFSKRTCSCGAEERAGRLEADGEVTYFSPWPEDAAQNP